MKRKIALLLVGAMVLSVTACSGKKDGGDATETTEVAMTDYKSLGEVELCDYMNISVEKTVTPVTEDDISTRLDEIIEENTQYNPLEEPISEGNYVEINFTGVSGDETYYDYADEAAGIVIGDEELGEEFDKEFIGKNVGDNFKLTVSYDEDFWNEDVAGVTLDYDVTIIAVYDVEVPEINQDLCDYLGYADVEDMKAKVKLELEAANDAESMEALNQEIIAEIIKNSNFTSYDQGLYEKCEQEVTAEYEEWAAMFGYESVDDTLEALGMTEEDFKQEILDRVYEKIAMSKIIDELGVTVTDEEFDAAVAEDAAEYEYETVEEYLADYGEENIRFSLLEAKACDIIKESCQITEVEAEPDEDMEFDEDEIDGEEISDEDIMLDEDEISGSDIEMEVDE